MFAFVWAASYGGPNRLLAEFYEQGDRVKFLRLTNTGVFTIIILR
jgi:hypothetical protein